VPDTNYTYVAEFLHNGERENAPDKALLFYPNDEAPIVINYFYAIETHTRDVDFMAWSRNNADLVDEYEDAYIKVDWLDVYFADEPGISITGYEQIDFSNGKVNGYILYSPKTNRRFVYVVSGGTEQCVMTFRRSEVVEEDVIDEKELNKVYEALVFAVVSTLRTA
jgi:hypothetical protein